jgi:hypothetical protein
MFTGAKSRSTELVRDLRTIPVVAVSSHDFGNAALQAILARSVCAKPDFARIGSVLATLNVASPPPNHAFQRTATGGGAFSVYHAPSRQPVA